MRRTFERLPPRLSESDPPRAENAVTGALLIVSHVRVRKHGGRHYLQGGFGRVVDGFAARFDHVHLLTCLEEVSSPPADYYLRASNVSLIGVRVFSQGSRLRRYISMTWAMAEAAIKLPAAIRACDVIHSRLPSVVGAVGALMSKFTSKPVFIYMAGDWEVEILSKGRSAAVRAAAAVVQRGLSFLVGERICFTAGERLAQKFGGPSDRVIPIMTTVMDRSHVVTVENAVKRAERQPTEILFVGRSITKRKGIYILLNALRQVRDRGIDAHLRIIGSADDGGTWLREQISARLHSAIPRSREITLEGALDPIAFWPHADVIGGSRWPGTMGGPRRS